MRNLLLVLIFFGTTLLFSAAYGQSTITGTVKSSKGDAIVGATIGIKGTSIGTTTDGNGHFTLQANNLEVSLVVSSVGFTTKTVPVNGKSTINIVLQQSVVSLNDLVVIGYGTQKKSDLSSAITSGNVKMNIYPYPALNYKLIPKQNKIRDIEPLSSSI